MVQFRLKQLNIHSDTLCFQSYIRSRRLGSTVGLLHRCRCYIPLQQCFGRLLQVVFGHVNDSEARAARPAARPRPTGTAAERHRRRLDLPRLIPGWGWG